MIHDNTKAARESGGKSVTMQKRWAAVLSGILILSVSGYLGVKDFLLFHAFAEGFTIVVSFTIAVIVFNTYKDIDNNFIPIIGIAYFCAGFFDVIHTLAYEGANIIPGAGPGLAPQMWVIARYLDSIGMLLAGISFYRAIRLPQVLASYVALSVIALLAVFYWNIFPQTFIPGHGLTGFKVYSEYIISLILVASIVLLMRHQNLFGPQVYRSLLLFFLISIATELSLTFYKTNGGWENVIGHLLKVTAYFFLYRAVVETNLQQPYKRVRDQARLLDLAYDFIIVRDMDSKVIYWNHGAEAGYGWTAGEAVGQVTHEFFQTEFPKAAEHIMADLLLEGHWEGELVHTRKDGGRLVVRSYQTLKWDAAGNPVSILEINHDVTLQKAAQEAMQRLNADLHELNASLEKEVDERQKAQETLGKLNDELENKVMERTSQLQEINATMEEEIAERQAAQESLRESRDELLRREEQLRYYSAELAATNDELKAFANIVAHDFRTPMVNLKGFSRELGDSLAELKQMIQDEIAGLPEDVRKKAEYLLEKDVPDSLGFIYSSVDRLDRMVNVLLSLAREGRREMIYKQVDTGELVANLLHSFDHQLERKGIGVEVGPLPSIEIDQSALEQIIGNLVDNAIKYLEPSRPGKIAVTCSDNGDEYLFTVRDNGRGIAAEDQEKVFEIFRRAGRQDVPGEGMGLAYVRTLVRRMGGRIWCESLLGFGTVMHFTVPKRSAAG